jgi:Hypoxia induced protein conserved region
LVHPLRTLLTTGAAATCFALLGAARMGYKKNSRGMQYFFRARVAAQAFTVLALWAGIYVYEDDRKAGNWKAREKAEANAKAKHVGSTILLLFRMPG